MRTLFVRKLNEITFVRFVLSSHFLPVAMGGFLRRLNCEVTAAQIFESADEVGLCAHVPNRPSPTIRAESNTPPCTEWSGIDQHGPWQTLKAICDLHIGAVWKKRSS
jgi:hypothetical protein